MPKYSAFTPFGQLRYSAKPSRFKQIYDGMKASLVRPSEGAAAPFDMTIGTVAEADLYATARCVAAGDALTEKAANQLDVNKVSDLLPNAERDYRIAPGSTDTMGERRAVLAARKRLPGGATWSNVTAALSELLGDEFYRYVPLQAYADRFPVDPASSVQVNAMREDVPARVARLTEAIGITGSDIWVGYETATDADPDAVFAAGDVVMVQPENTGLSEKVAIVDVRENDDGTRDFKATFTNAHDEGATVTTQSWPWQLSMAHHHLVIVTSTVARDAVWRQRIDDLMQRMMRAPSTWSIVEPTSVVANVSVTVGPTTVSGVLGAQTIAAATYQLL